MDTNFSQLVTNGKFVITCFNRNKKIVALNASNLERVWEHKHKDNQYNINRKIFVDDNKLYFATESNSDSSGIYCLNADEGSLLWEKSILGDIKYITKMENMIYGHTSKNTLFKLSLDKLDLETIQLTHEPVSNIEKRNEYLYYYAKEGLVEYDFETNKEKIVISYDGIESRNRLDAQIIFTN